MSKLVVVLLIATFLVAQVWSRCCQKSCGCKDTDCCGCKDTDCCGCKNTHSCGCKNTHSCGCKNTHSCGCKNTHSCGCNACGCKDSCACSSDTSKHIKIRLTSSSEESSEDLEKTFHFHIPIDDKTEAPAAAG